MITPVENLKHRCLISKKINKNIYLNYLSLLETSQETRTQEFKIFLFYIRSGRVNFFSEYIYDSMLVPILNTIYSEFIHVLNVDLII